jgi:hypothetical protein
MPLELPGGIIGAAIGALYGIASTSFKNLSKKFVNYGTFGFGNLKITISISHQMKHVLKIHGSIIYIFF